MNCLIRLRKLTIFLAIVIFFDCNDAKPLKFKSKLNETVDSDAAANRPEGRRLDADNAQFVAGLESPRRGISPAKATPLNAAAGANEKKKIGGALDRNIARDQPVRGGVQRVGDVEDGDGRDLAMGENIRDAEHDNLDKKFDHPEEIRNSAEKMKGGGNGFVDDRDQFRKVPDLEKDSVDYEKRRRVDSKEEHDEQIVERDHLQMDRNHKRESWKNRGGENSEHEGDNRDGPRERVEDKKRADSAAEHPAKKRKSSAEAAKEAAPPAMAPRPVGPSRTPVALEELQPPDHIDGLRMEHDGHLNRDYKKEVLLGEHHGEFESETDPRLPSRLMTIFKSADTDGDGGLVQSELRDWIMRKVQEHLDDAQRETDRIFDHLDADQDGYIKWTEFQIHFLLAKGHTRKQLDQHVGDYDSMLLDSGERERMLRYKFRWAEADEPPQDNRLTRDELQNFRHPEQSPTMLSRMVRDIIDNLDHDGDDIITEEEFVALPRGAVEMEGAGDQDRAWQDERRKEFQEVIDLNGDGKVDERELKIYVDPHNANHASLEADTLIQLADDNSDGRLSLEEVLDNAELFFGSKAVNAGGNFHDEF